MLSERGIEEREASQPLAFSMTFLDDKSNGTYIVMPDGTIPGFYEQNGHAPRTERLDLELIETYRKERKKIKKCTRLYRTTGLESDCVGKYALLQYPEGRTEEKQISSSKVLSDQNKLPTGFKYAFSKILGLNTTDPSPPETSE